MKADIGIIGLGVMGRNLALNMAGKDLAVALYNRTTDKVDEFTASHKEQKNLIACHNLKVFTASLKGPRKIMLMVKAGKPVDSVLKTLIPLLNENDIIIDGGNSNYEDTEKRIKLCDRKKIYFAGAGISGGTEGALRGPSIMVGGACEAWLEIKEILQSIAAKIDNSLPCCELIGPGGAGHFVKMVHNGIEYSLMQSICETYHLMKSLLKIPAQEICHIFEAWNNGPLNSYLIEITSKILKQTDDDGSPIIDKILDSAGQKGTGVLVCKAALEFGVPFSLTTESVFARYISTLKDERVKASEILRSHEINFSAEKDNFIKSLNDALHASMIISYAQGFHLMRAASGTYNWKLNYGTIAQIWRGGCIIRSKLLEEIKKAFDENPEYSNLMLTPYFAKQLIKLQSSLRNVASAAISKGIPVPVISSAVSYFDSYRRKKLPTNLLQAQRDYFGAHMYEKIDKQRGTLFHTNWDKN